MVVGKLRGGGFAGRGKGGFGGGALVQEGYQVILGEWSCGFTVQVTVLGFSVFILQVWFPERVGGRGWMRWRVCRWWFGGWWRSRSRAHQKGSGGGACAVWSQGSFQLGEGDWARYQG